MFDLTKHEKMVITFLSLSFLVGSGILYYQKSHSPVELEVLPLEAETESLLREARLVNINEASLKELTRLPGIGPVLAQRILDYRKSYGPFKKLDDIRQVEGIGPKKFSQIRELLTLE